MSFSEVTAPPANTSVTVTGFSFENVARNSTIIDRVVQEEQQVASSYVGENPNAAAAGVSGAQLPKPKKTGTTIAGLVFDKGVVLAADTRATNDTEVAEKACMKIAYLAPNMYVCGAGTAADTDKTASLIRSQLELLRMDTYSQSRVVTACTMMKRLLFRYQGYIGAAMILGGCDVNGPHLYQIHPHGSTGKMPFSTMGSGSLAAVGVFETGWRENLSEEEAVQLSQRAILAGIFNDLGSGSNVDICIIRTDGTADYRRHTLKPNELAPVRATVNRSARLVDLPVGLTPVLETKFKPHPTTPSNIIVNKNKVDDGAVTEMEVEA